MLFKISEFTNGLKYLKIAYQINPNRNKFKFVLKSEAFKNINDENKLLLISDDFYSNQLLIKHLK